MEQVSAALSEARAESSISFGLAELRSGESLEDLIARGDAELSRLKQNGHCDQ